MRRLITIALATAALVAACGGATAPPPPPEVGSSTTTQGLAAGTPPATVGDTTTTMPAPLTTSAPARSCLHADETPFRSRFSETAEGYQSEILREIDGDNAQWVMTFPVTESFFGFAGRAQIIIGEDVWTLREGEWEPFPMVPLRWPLLVWVNGYVTGKGVAANFDAAESEEIAGIPATVYRGGIEEMTAAFPGKMRGREFVPEMTTYTYWVDACGDLLKAEVVIELGGEEREIAIDFDLPTTYRYDYVVYDVGADFTIVPPGPGYLPAIPAPMS